MTTEEQAQIPDDGSKQLTDLILKGDHENARSEEHTSELQSPCNLVCRLLLEKKKKKKDNLINHIQNNSIYIIISSTDLPTTSPHNTFFTSQSIPHCMCNVNFSSVAFTSVTYD